MLEFQNRPAFPAIQGFDYAQMKKVVPLDRYLTAGSLDQLDDDSIIRELARIEPSDDGVIVELVERPGRQVTVERARLFSSAHNRSPGSPERPAGSGIRALHAAA